MSQHDFNIENQLMPAARLDINNALEALATLSSGAAPPDTTKPNQLWMDEANGILKIRKTANDGWISLFRLDQALGSVDTLRPGDIVLTLGSSARPGTVKANGANLSRTAYPELFAEWGTSFGAGDGSTTFGTPDLRGLFPRFWDDGRGIDTGRAIGTDQAERLPPHAHRMPIGWDSSQGYGWRSSTDSGPIFGSELSAASVSRLTFSTVSAANGLVRIAYTDTGILSQSGELRPRNFSFLACIKY